MLEDTVLKNRARQLLAFSRVGFTSRTSWLHISLEWVMLHKSHL